MPNDNILDKSVVLSLEIHSLGQTRQADINSVDVVEGGEKVEGVDKNKLKLSKRILDCPQFREIRKLDAKIKQVIKNKTVSGTKKLRSGFYLVPKDSIVSLFEDIKLFVSERQPLVDALIQVYPDLIEADKQSLKTLFDQSNYPSVEQAASQFYVEYAPVDFSTPGSLKDIQETLYDAEKEREVNRWLDAGKEIEQSLIAEAIKLVDGLVDKLRPGSDGKNKRINQPTFDTLSSFLSELKNRNLTGSEEIDELNKRITDAVTGVSAKDVRTNDELRNSLKAKFEAIQGSIEVVDNVRVFKFEEDKEEIEEGEAENGTEEIAV